MKSSTIASDAEENEPIDLVYLWVDGSDPAFRALKREHLAREPGRLHDAQLSGDEARYLQMGEIAYSVRSARRFAPWIRNIHIVVKPGQKPPVDLDDPRIRLIEEPAILPEEIQPTFASPSIEPFVHRIPGLSEIFIYANDDFLFWKPTPREHFVDRGRLQLRGHFQSKARSRITAAIKKGHGRIVNRTALMLHDHGISRVHLPEHSFHVMRRSTCERVWAEFGEQLRPAVALRFRDDDRCLFWQTMVNSLEVRDHPTGTVWTIGAAQLSFAHVETNLFDALRCRVRLALLGVYAPRTICFNTVPASWHGRIRAFLDRHYGTDDGAGEAGRPSPALEGR
jgi:hypothetical protein